MRAEQNDAVTCCESRVQVLSAFDAHAPPHLVGRAEPAHGHLDERRTERREVLAGKHVAFRAGKTRKAGLEISLDDSAARRQHAVRGNTETLAERDLPAHRQQRGSAHAEVREPRYCVAEPGELECPKGVRGHARVPVRQHLNS